MSSKLDYEIIAIVNVFSFGIKLMVICPSLPHQLKLEFVSLAKG